jgi:hypothetical protein
MKKTLALLLSLALILALCGGCLFNGGLDRKLVRGSWNDDVYTNEFADIRFTLPEGWLAATDEEIANLMGLAAETLEDEDKWAVEAAKLTTVYDMMAQDPATGNNIIVMFENLSMVIGGTSMSEEDYLKSAKEQVASMSLMDYTFNEPYHTEIGGVQYLTSRADSADIGLSQYYLMHKQDKYMVALIVTIFDETDAEDIIGQFS